MLRSKIITYIFFPIQKILFTYLIDLIQQGKLPEAYYRIHDLEAQKFVGKCLANVSERLSAKELLLDPFLATEQLDSPLPSPTLPKKQTPTLNFTALLAKELPPPKSNQTKDTHMTITGSMNEENDTVFLKVQISNKNGMHIKFQHKLNLIHNLSTPKKEKRKHFSKYFQLSANMHYFLGSF